MPTSDDAFKTRLSAEGEITLPEEVCRRKGWAPGTELTIEETPQGILLKAARVFPETRIEDVYGMLHRPGMKPVSVEEMHQAIVDESCVAMRSANITPRTGYASAW